MAQVPVHKIKKQPRAFTVGVLVVACIYFIVPVWWLFVAATKTNSGLFFGAHGSLWFDKKFAL